MNPEKPVFKPFNPYESIYAYRRQLPHWRQNGACYFVTWRLNDSIPETILELWQEEREIWLVAHGIDVTLKGDEWRTAYEKISSEERRIFEKSHHHKFNECLDAGHGTCCLRDPMCARIALESLFFFNGERCWTGDSVIMPNHIHTLIVPKSGFELEQILHSIKRYAAREINKILQREGRLWQKDSYDHIVRGVQELRAFRKYIAKNAAQAKLKLNGNAYQCTQWLDEYAVLD